MSNDREKQYCVIDHTSEKGDRERRNPNYAARRQATRRRAEMADRAVHGTGLADDSPTAVPQVDTTAHPAVISVVDPAVDPLMDPLVNALMDKLPTMPDRRRNPDRRGG